MKKNCISDFHLHTEFSFDSKEKLDNICQAAVDIGLGAIAVTNHYDHDGIDEGLYDEYLFEKDMENILSAKEKWKSVLSVHAGIEIGQPHTMNDKKICKIEKMGYEFIIGSLHNLKNCFDFHYLDYKKTTSMYDKAIYEKYIKELLEMAGCPFLDTIGHITYPERYMKEAGKDFVYSWHQEGFALLFEKMAKNKIGLEINTSGIRQGVGHTMPNVNILSLFKKCGGEYVTIGSDAHMSKHVGMNIAEVFSEAVKMGFSRINEIRR
jgi:histidinol-phosphatase (PHP family)